MTKYKINRKLKHLALLLMTAACLYGCSRDGNVVYSPESGAKEAQKEQAMGRYTESEIPLPEGVTFHSAVTFFKGPDGKMVLITREDVNGTAEYTGYLLSEDLTWEEKECGWLNQLKLDYKHSRIGITYGEDRKLYAVYSEEGDPDLIPRSRVVVTEDWEHSREIEIPVLLETDEYGYSYSPDEVMALENGSLLFNARNSLFLYDAAGQERIAEIVNRDGKYFTRGSQFYIIDSDSKSLIRYNGEDGKEEERYPLELDDYYGLRAAVSGNGDISLVTAAGIQILKDGSGMWEQIAEGKRYTMGSPKYYVEGFAEGGQEDYFIFYNSMDETCKLSHYVYQKDMPVEPETELTIFSLRDNTTIRQAVSEFQIVNPNVKIDFQPMLEEEDTAIAEDYIRSLNAELLSGGGPDILILDGLSELSYIEKGVLEDLTDEIESLISNGDFLANIAEGSRVDGRIYSVPVRIGLPMTFGRKEALKDAEQLDSLSRLVKEHETGQIFGTIDREAFLSLYADAYIHDIVSEQGTVKEQELTDFLSRMKTIFDNTRIADGTKDNRQSSIWGLLEHGTYLYSMEVAGFFEAEQGTSIVEQAKGELEADMITMNQTYVPYGTIAVNKAGKNKELAVQFLTAALSETVQRSDFYDGFPVNENALEFLTGIERNSADGYGGFIDGADGRTYEWKYSWPSEPLRRRLVDFCKAAKNSAGRNQKIKQILMENSKDYFDGIKSLEETVHDLQSRITLYLQE